MLKDMVQKVKELSDQFENENEKMDCFTTIFSFVDFFIIKHFTNLSSELNGLDIKNTINVFNMLQDNGFRTEIIKYFNENCVDEIDKIKIMLDNFGKNITEMTKDMQKSFDDSLDTIEKATNTSAEDIQVVENEKHRLKMDEKTDTISFVE
jgi:hypothetical protein